MKQILTKIGLVFITLACLSTAVCGAAGVISFSDVPAEYWGYKTIMEMTEAGIFKGTTEPVNGVGIFSPEKVMTRAEFITASLRAIYPEEAKSIGNDSTKWWNGYYAFALQKGIVNTGELDGGDLDKPMSREEMAMIMARCVKNNGEELTAEVESAKIYDYNEIGDYYKDYVQDCFSFGLLGGVDIKGTFLPAKSLTRAEAATVLCRLTDYDARINVAVAEASGKDGTVNSDNADTNKEDNGGGNNQGNTSSGGNYKPKPDTNNPQTPDDEEKIELPWENGGKPTSEYTREEFEALSESMQNAFYDSFENETAFEEWYNSVQGSQNMESELPWEKGGKPTSEYTWEEFEALSESMQNAFYDSFENETAFEEWYNSVQGSQNMESEFPWENGGKPTSEYTWEEYENLPESIKNAFYESFESEAAFEEWFSGVQQSQQPENDFPWDDPAEYTWEEFEALSDSLKEEFANSFDTLGGFAEWLNKNQP